MKNHFERCFVKFRCSGSKIIIFCYIIIPYKEANLTFATLFASQTLQNTIATQTLWNTIATQTPWNTIASQTPWNTIASQTPWNTIATQTPWNAIATQTPWNTIAKQIPVLFAVKKLRGVLCSSYFYIKSKVSKINGYLEYFTLFFVE